MCRYTKDGALELELIEFETMPNSSYEVDSDIRFPIINQGQ